MRIQLCCRSCRCRSAVQTRQARIAMAKTHAQYGARAATGPSGPGLQVKRELDRVVLVQSKHWCLFALQQLNRGSRRRDCIDDMRPSRNVYVAFGPPWVWPSPTAISSLVYLLLLLPLLHCVFVFSSFVFSFLPFFLLFFLSLRSRSLTMQKEKSPCIDCVRVLRKLKPRARRERETEKSRENRPPYTSSTSSIRDTPSPGRLCPGPAASSCFSCLCLCLCRCRRRCRGQTIYNALYSR
jgi:hypothetical protein